MKVKIGIKNGDEEFQLSFDFYLLWSRLHTYNLSLVTICFNYLLISTSCAIFTTPTSTITVFQLSFDFYFVVATVSKSVFTSFSFNYLLISTPTRCRRSPPRI